MIVISVSREFQSLHLKGSKVAWVGWLNVALNQKFVLGDYMGDFIFKKLLNLKMSRKFVKLAKFADFVYRPSYNANIVHFNLTIFSKKCSNSTAFQPNLIWVPCMSIYSYSICSSRQRQNKILENAPRIWKFVSFFCLPRSNSD